MNQPDIYDMAFFVAECLALSSAFLDWLQAFFKRPLRCPTEAYAYKAMQPFLEKRKITQAVKATPHIN